MEKRIINCYRVFLIAIFSGRTWMSKVKPGIDEELLISRCNQVLETLPKARWQKVLRLRFGLDDGERKTLEKVGQEVNKTTKQNISQIVHQALRFLRHPARSKYLRDFIILPR